MTLTRLCRRRVGFVRGAGGGSVQPERYLRLRGLSEEKKEEEVREDRRGEGGERRNEERTRKCKKSQRMRKEKN